LPRNDRATRPSLRIFLTLRCSLRCALTNSSSSIPTQTTVTCGLPFEFSVVRRASGPVDTSKRTDSGIIRSPPDATAPDCRDLYPYVVCGPERGRQFLKSLLRSG